MSRTLHYFHITHMPEDYKGYRVIISDAEAVTEGRAEWKKINNTLKKMTLGANVKVYQDSFSIMGLPDGKAGISAEGPPKYVRAVVRGLAQGDSPNVAALRFLFANGCVLVSTENVALSPFMQNVGRLSQSQLFLLMQQRNQVIAETINQTLQEGDIGILFLGKGHDIADLLDTTITLRHYCRRRT